MSARNIEVKLPASPLARVQAFMAAFQAANNDADLELRVGETGDGEAAIAISLNGKTHGFTAGEARRLARIAENAMRACPRDPAAATLPNLILALRAGADKAEAALKGGDTDAR